jgi:hypothetical protein
MTDESEQPAFRSIGSLLPSISPSRPSAGLTARPRPSASAITGLPSPERRVANSIGMRRGETGAVAMLPTVTELLKGDSPETTDKALLASLPPSVASSLVSKSRDFVDPVYGFDTEFVGWDLADVEQTDRSRAADLVWWTLAPADARMILGEIARLRAMTKARAESNTDLEMLAHVYAEELANYPPDVIRAACRGWARREKWWPSWAELKDCLDRAVRRRQALWDTLAGKVRR